MSHLSENILVTPDWFPSMNELVSSDMKVNCSTSDDHKVSLFLEVKNVVDQCYDLMHTIFGGPV